MEKLKFLHQLWNNFRYITALCLCCLVFTYILLNAQVYGAVSIILIMCSPLIALGVFGIIECCVKLSFFIAYYVIEINNKRKMP